MFDLLIKNARVIDGTGMKWFRADVGVKDGRIAAVGKLSGEAAGESVDAGDRYLCPGFIDIHSHSDTSIIGCPTSDSRILQGVTTEITGNCGIGMAPATDENLALLKSYTDGAGDFSWRGVGDFLAAVERARPSTNIGTLLGHGTVRLAVMGYSAKKATAAELARMKELTAQGMRDGAFGMSSGLIYPPGSYADEDELAEVVSAIAPFGGFYATHMRDEDDDIVNAVNEAMNVARRANVPLEISHHKVCSKAGWRVLCKSTIAMIEKARAEGLDVTCDQYPYRATATTLSVNVPEWAFEGGFEALKARLADPTDRARIREHLKKNHDGRWETLVVSFVDSKESEWKCGMTIPEIAAKLGVDCADALLDTVVAENNRVGEVHFTMCEDDIEYIMKNDFVMTGSDGEARPLGGSGRPHPRNYGTFPRVIAYYCRERQLFSLEKAIFKMTGMPAARTKLFDRGIIRPGARADLVLFDFERIKDDPTYENPMQACSGIDRVWVNGVLTAKDGVHTGARAGMCLRLNK